MKFVLLAIVILGGLALIHQDNPPKLVITDDYKFSNTMDWDPGIELLGTRPIKTVTNWEDFIEIPPPSPNTSELTIDELDFLVSSKDLRTPDKVKEIKDEANIESLVFGGRPMTDYLNFEKYPYTASLISNGYRDITTIVVILKKRYDRVRPSILEPEIRPVLEVPGHPAYPSGHSTQAHFMAYMLAEVFPEQRELLIEEADRIGINREIAGLHYPSDTKAGKILAREFVDALLAKPEIQSLLPKIREELKR